MRGQVAVTTMNTCAPLQVATSLGLSLDDLHVPLLVRATYGDFPVKLVAVLRHPADRIHSAYWALPHYHGKYGDTPEVPAVCPALSKSACFQLAAVATSKHMPSFL